MKTTIFSAFKAIVTITFICVIGLTESKAQWGPAPGTTYTIQNNTTCTYIVDIEEKDFFGCATLFTHTGITINPGTNLIMLTTTCTPPFLCDIVITVTSIANCSQAPFAPVSVSNFGSPFATGSCGLNSANVVCNFRLIWGQFSATIL